MTRTEILDIIKESIVEETPLEDSSVITEHTTANQVPGWDSLAHVRIMLNIEMETDIEVPIEMTYKTKNIGELVTLFEAA